MSFRVLALSLIILVTSCGGSGGNKGSVTELATCSSAFTACGGDIVGDWTLTQTCGPLLTYTCSSTESIPVDTSQVTLSWQLSFDGNGQFTESISEVGPVQADVPSDCTDGYTCANLGPQIPAAFFNTVSNVTCTDTSTGCHCTGTYSIVGSASGSYITSNGVVTLASTTDSSTSTQTINYCVNGGTMTTGSATSSSMMTLSK